jgi:flagellin
MSLRINHNLAALNAHRNLIDTTAALSKSMQKLSSGYRINQGSDDPAGLVISEQFRAQIAGLNRAISNSEGSISMIQTAEGALTEINNLMVSMRELAIHAANEGFNDADQLAADQAEIANAIKTIDRIAANTQFGTKKLLDGTKENVATVTTANSSLVNVKSSDLRTGTYSLVATKTADATAALNTTAYGISLANTDGDPMNITEGVHNIDVVQASDVARKVGSSFSITDAWNQGLEVAALGAVGSVGMAAQFTTAIATDAGTYTVYLNYQDQESNSGAPTGLQSLSVNVTTGTTTADVKTQLESAIAANTALAGNVTVRASASGTANQLFLESANAGAQFSVHTEASSSTGNTTNMFTFGQTSDRGVSTNTLDLTTNTWGPNVTATGLLTNEVVTIGAATYTDMATLVAAVNTGIAAATYTDSTSDITAFAGGSNNVEIRTVDEGSNYYIRVNQSGGVTADLNRALGLTVDTQNNSGVDGLVNFDGYTNTITDVRKRATGTFTLASAETGDSTQATIDIITAMAKSAGGTGIAAGQMLATVTGTKLSVRLGGGAAVTATAGQDVTVFTGDRSQSITVQYGLSSNGGNETISNTDQSLVFQIGANVGQTTNISMRNMAASSLAQDVAGNMFTSLAAIDVTTAQGAQDAQTLIDTAINEVSTTRGTLGSFQKNTLEANLRNLRIASQNLTAAESGIRDTDMAREMSEFTKFQILLQAGTAMLAQANQVPQVVLSLF